MELRTACTDPGGLPGDNFSDLFCSLQSSGRGQSTACDRPSNVGGFHRGQSDLAGNSMQRPECLSGAEHPDANSSVRAKGPRLATVETKALPILVLPSLHHFNILFGHTSVLRWGTEHRVELPRRPPHSHHRSLTRRRHFYPALQGSAPTICYAHTV